MGPMCKITRISRVYTMCLTRVTRENFTGFPREIHMLLLVGRPNSLEIVRPNSLIRSQ